VLNRLGCPTQSQSFLEAQVITPSHCRDSMRLLTDAAEMGGPQVQRPTTTPRNRRSLGAAMPREARLVLYRLIYPISLPSARHRDLIARCLHRRNVDTGRPYRGIANVAGSYYGYTGDCPVSEQVAERVLAIPSHHRLTRTDVQRIAKYLNTGWPEHSGHRSAMRSKEGSAINA
jgi:hypothetical protein